MTSLPTNIAETYPDRGDGDTAHQQHHDIIHEALNELTNTPPGTTTWGDVVGTLLDQLDLAAALGAKADEADLGTAAFEDTTAFDAVGTAAAEVAAHEAHIDPHTQYMTEAEADAAYDPAGAAAAVAATLGTAAAADTTDFATATQGALADTAVQPAGLTPYAPLASPILTGTPTAPTAATATNTQQIATTAFVQAVVAALIDAAPGLLNTLNEIAAALGDDPNFAATMTTALAGKQPLDGDLTAVAGAGNGTILAAITAAFTTALETKLNGIAAGATVNSPDATLLARANHTGTQAISTVSGLQAAIDAKMDVAQVLNNQTGTDYTIVAADRGKLVTLTNAAAIEVVVPTATSLGLSPGDSIDFAVLGAGMATFVADTGATVNATPSAISRSQYSAMTLVVLTTTSWLLVGDLA